MKNAQIIDQPQLLTAEGDNILDFSSTLRELRKHVDPNRLRQREAWHDRNGNVRTVD